MIPWFNINFPSIPFPIIGKLTIHAFGILVAIGILVGLKLTKKRGRELGLVDEHVDSMVTWSLVFGFITAHFFDVFAYQTFGSHPRLIDILNPISGFSSFGGFTGALVGLFIYCWRTRQPVMPMPIRSPTDWLRAGCSVGSAASPRTITRAATPASPRGAISTGRDTISASTRRCGRWASRSCSRGCAVGRSNPLGLYVTLLTIAYAPVRFGLDFCAPPMYRSRTTMLRSDAGAVGLRAGAHRRAGSRPLDMGSRARDTRSTSTASR
jgi:phosphatidylglycerol:prolipoprotein diacylglycerol transferase